MKSNSCFQLNKQQLQANTLYPLINSQIETSYHSKETQLRRSRYSSTKFK